MCVLGDGRVAGKHRQEVQRGQMQDDSVSKEDGNHVGKGEVAPQRKRKENKNRRGKQQKT